MRRALLLAVLVLTAGVARGQDAPRAAGEKLRESLEAPRESLAPVRLKDAPPQGDVRLAAYMGLSRVGDISFHTEIVEKAGEKLYSIEDRLDIDAPGFGVVHMLVTGDLAPDLSARELTLETESPGPSGATVRRRLSVAPEDGALVVTETRDEGKAEKRRLEGQGLRALLLTPPLGVGERLTRLAPGEVGSRLSFAAFDLANGKATDLRISFEEQAATDVRGEKLTLERATREEGAATLELWLDPATREPVKLARGDASLPRVTFVGREGDTKRDLPARAGEGPADVVLRFLRATGNTDSKAAAAGILACVDVDALYARATAKATPGVDAADPRFRKAFERALIARLASDEWRRGESVKLLAGAARADDFSVDVTGGTAKVRPKGRPDAAPFELKKTASGWKIVALPGS